MDNQFYPTPSSLASKMKSKFTRPVQRLLEPHAGRGDLLEPFDTSRNRYQKLSIDCIEIDFDNQAILRGKGYPVIDSDFLQFQGGAEYSHIIMNPPFNAGVEHTLKAWDILNDGELVSIINAESLVPEKMTKKAIFLSKIIEDNAGTVEIIESAFTTPETKRKTEVKIALIYIRKQSETFHVPLDGLDKDSGPSNTEETVSSEIGFHNSTIKSTVAAFNAAVRAMKNAVTEGAKADRYASLIGVHFKSKEEGTSYNSSAGLERFVDDNVNTRINCRYADLKSSAWKTVLNATEFNKILSSQAYKRLMSEFDQILTLEFTETNVKGFLRGLIMQKGTMDTEMIADVFDYFTKYHSDNRFYFKGWKSNDKHRDGAFKLKNTRFIIPRAKEFYSSHPEIHSDMKRTIADIDKVFAMMDSVDKAEISLLDVFDRPYDKNDNSEKNVKSRELNEQIYKSKRVKTSYFDVRYYHGAGTIHFFPTRPDLIDRMNRTVGKMRQWLPDTTVQSDPTFWEQYDKADKVTAEMAKEPSFNNHNGYGRYRDKTVEEMHETACDNLGIPVYNQLEADNFTKIEQSVV